MSAALSEECAANWCGHVDTDARFPDEHGSMSNYDWDAVLYALLHVVGHCDDLECYACYSAVAFLADEEGPFA